MLDDKERKKIIELIKQGKSNYRIHKVTGHHASIIGKIRENYKNTEKNQIPEEDIRYTNAIHTIRGAINYIETYIQTGELNERERKKEERILEKLREMQRVEVDERISKERADIVQKRDLEWNQTIKESYVKKEVATQLQNTIQEKENIITSLQNNIITRDNAHEEDQKKIMIILEKQRYDEFQKQNINTVNIGLNSENQRLRNYIEYHLDNEVRQGQEQLKYDRDKLETEETRFNEYRKNHLSDIKNSTIEIEKRTKAVEMREKQVTEREEKIQTGEKELEASKNRWNKQYSECIASIKTRVKNIAYDYCDELVKQSFKKQLEWINQQWKKIHDQKEQITKEREIFQSQQKINEQKD